MKSEGEQATTAKCVACRARIFFNRRPELGDYVTCPECQAHLEIVALSPLRLDWLYEDDSHPIFRQAAHDSLDAAT